MRTYYRGPEVVVTDSLFVWRSDRTVSLVLRDLRNLAVLRIQGPRLTPVIVAALSFAFAGIVLAAVVRDGWALWVGSSAAVAALGLSWNIVRQSPTIFTLRGVYRGSELVVYSSRDERVFHQVCRALRRAMEDMRSVEGLAEGWYDIGA